MTSPTPTGPLRFTRFRVWEVVVPARADLIAAGEGEIATWPDMPVHLVEGETTGGFFAVGESSRGEPWEVVERTLRALLDCDLGMVHPATAWASGQEPSGLPSAYSRESWHFPKGRSYPLFETLWLDAIGKSAGVPAHTLLGGAVRDRVAVDYWANRPNAAALEKILGEAVSLGLGGLKLKCSALGDTARALAAVGAPEGFHVTIDPMCAWRTFRESRSHFECLAKLPCEVRIEDPFPHAAPDEWRRAANAFPGLTYVWHARDDATLSTALREGLGDVLNLSGPSVFDFLRSAGLARWHGRDCWQGSALELGVQQAWRLHASACAPNCVLPSDLQSEWVREHTLTSPQMEMRDGFARVTNKPGLGVALDHDAIPHFLCRCREVV